MVPKPKPQRHEPKEDDRQMTLDDVEDADLRAEMEALESAGIQDFLEWEESLDEE
jgi:hypothetical protein